MRKTSAQRLTTSASSRRGVLLLVILGMLTLFLMIGTAFIMSGNQYRRANKSYSKVGEQKNLQASQDGFLTEVINQIIRDTANQNSSLRFHSLLRDLYGTEGLIAPKRTQSLSVAPGAFPNNLAIINFNFAGIGAGLGNVTNGQMLEFTLPNNYQDVFGREWQATGTLAISKPFATLDDAFNGMTLTFIEGPAKGYTTRIVGYEAANRRVRIMNFPGEYGQPITSAAFLTSLNGSRILINGRPFNGTGVGYNPLAGAAAPKLDTFEIVPTPDGPVNVPLALAPNSPFFIPNPGTNIVPEYFNTAFTTLAAAPRQALLNNMGYEGQGGSDESYDAADFQNMFLAWTTPNPEESVLPSNISSALPTPLPANLGGLVLPSFHRPDLLHYWANQFLETPGDLSSTTLGKTNGLPVLRKVLLRPNWHDHPDFDGSNPEYAALRGDSQEGTKKLLRMIFGPWDVDNDMDGVRDSVWVDFGAPVMVGSKGKLVKPLAAILVLDMDGRLNVNAHGTREFAGMGGGLEMVPASDPAGTSALPQTDRWNNIPRGQGFGVAEIDLGQLLNGGTYQRLMSGDRRDIDNDGDPEVFLAGRYGTPYASGSDNEPGFKDAFDLSAQLKMQGLPAHFNNTLLLTRSNYGRLPDFRARYKTALNDFGQFVTTWTPQDSLAHSLDEDNPYELDLSSTGARGEGTSVDNPFSPAELERLLRAYDLDAGTLSPRLFELLKGDQPNADPDALRNWRTLLTTDSYDLPEPGVQLPWWVRNGPNNTKELPGDTQSDDFDNVMGRQPVNATYADLVEYRLRISQNPPWFASQDAANATRLPLIQRQMRMLIAPEMMAGLKLDLNRPFGNGRDDNNNGIVDEPGEWNETDGDGQKGDNEGEGTSWLIDETRTGLPASQQTADFQNSRFWDAMDRNGDGVIEPWERGYTESNGDGNPVGRASIGAPLTHKELVNMHNFRRQLLARHLYVLAYALVDPFPIDPANNTLPQASKIKARQLAQWAINAVDFRDPDNIMTAFEYDENPFDGWSVDGNVAHAHGPDNTQGNADDDVANQRAVVWGMESPDLLITETLAWHDRRTTDTAREEIDPQYLGTRSDPGTLEDSDPKKRDPHMDQQYRPKGAAFIELYNPNAPSAGVSADTHAVQGFNINSNQPGVVQGQDMGVNLSAVAVDPTDDTVRSPVWRIQVVRNRKKDGVTSYGNDMNPMLLFYDPEDREALPADYRPDVDRTIYFTRQANIAMSDASPYAVGLGFPEASYQGLDSTDGVEFFTDLGVRPVRPGTYMVVGSGEETAANSGIFRSPVGLTFVNNNPAQSGKIGRRIELRIVPNLTGTEAPVQVFNSATNPPAVTTPMSAGQYVADVAIINRVIDRSRDGIVQGPADRAFTFSEPANGYPTRLPSLGSLWSTTNMPSNGPEVEGWYVNGPNSTTPLPFDIPLDDNETAVRPVDPDLKHYGTVQGYRWIYLQRLANPMLPFNPEPGQPGHNANRPVNPYMTIDHSSVNLSVFNGLINSAIVPNLVNPEANFGNSPAISGELSSMERGWRNDPSDLAVTKYSSQLQKTEVATHYSNANPYNVENSGKRPRNNSRFPAGSGHFFNAMPDCSLGHLNQGFTQNYVANKVTPNQPFPWLTWNNRPFANAGELILVPAMRSSQLLRTFSLIAGPTSPTGIDTNLRGEVYASRVNAELNIDAQNPSKPYYEYIKKFLPLRDGPYGHLLNFFRATSAGADNQPNTSDDQGLAGLHRVLDFVSVPSKYVGNETWLNPATFSSTPVVQNTLDPRYGLQPPFNKIGSRREPGRVNINTMSQGVVWRGLFHGSAKRHGKDQGHPVIDDDYFASVRRGYGTFGQGPTQLDPNSPTLFANPFRSSQAGDLVPTVPMLRTGIQPTLLRTMGKAASTTPDPLEDDLYFRNSDVVQSASTAQNDDVPLFAAVTLGSVSTANNYRDANRNPYFRYSPITRLSSLSTTRSNVFAIWVTIGFFEVEEFDESDPNHRTILARFGTGTGTLASASADPLFQRVYPDGYMFTKEAGIETGEIERVREFAIVDRTIPVAFEPGANHNIGEMIRLRRKIKTE